MQKIKFNLFYLINILLISILVFPPLTTIITILIAIFLFKEKYNLKKTFTSLINNKYSVLIFILPTLYIMYILGMIYSSNIEYGLKKLETKFGMFLYPLLIPLIKQFYNGKYIYQLKKNYINGVIVISIICLIIAIIRFSYELYCREYRIILEEYPYTNYFFSSYLSLFMHYGYFAMYVNVAIISLYDLFLKKMINKKHFLFSVFFLSLFVLMLYSKTGIFSMLLIHIIYFLFIIKKSILNKKIILSIFFTIVTLIVLLFTLIPHTTDRIKIIKDTLISKKLDPNSTESTQLRTFAWKASISLIKNNPLLGYGTGDVNDVLLNEYQIKGYFGALKKEMNAHNQFLQTWLSIGILGFIVLLSFFIYCSYIGIKESQIPILIFAIISFIAFLFESFLETQVGVFYISVLSFLNFNFSKYDSKLSSAQ